MVWSAQRTLQIHRLAAHQQRQPVMTTMLSPVQHKSAQPPNGPSGDERRAAAIVDLLDRITATSDPQTAFATLVQELENYLDCRSVLLGLAKVDRIECKLTAATAHWNSEETAAIEAAMAECLAREHSGLWPPPENAPRQALLAHKALAQITNSESVLSLPLRDRHGVVQAVLVILSDDSLIENRTTEQFLHAASQPLASVLSLAKKSQPTWWRKLTGQIVEGVRSRKLIAGLAGVLVAIGVLLIPMPYRIACECELEPVTRRFVAAPFDGKLERAEVEPGDLVSQGQLLAVMDGREIRWELAGLLAEQSQARKERDGHMAKHDFGSAQVAKLEMDRLKVREQLLTKRSEHLEIRSPIEGLVVMGDLKKSEGVPLSVGERLFEIAPLEQMVVEVLISEADIAWAKPDQTVDIVLDAYPETTWTGTLTRIHPRAELREEEHVFIGEVILDNPDAVLRPGMRGRAKITGPKKPLGWNLFHQPWYELRYWLGW